MVKKRRSHLLLDFLQIFEEMLKELLVCKVLGMTSCCFIAGSNRMKTDPAQAGSQTWQTGVSAFEEDNRNSTDAAGPLSAALRAAASASLKLSSNIVSLRSAAMDTEMAEARPSKIQGGKLGLSLPVQ